VSCVPCAETEVGSPGVRFSTLNISIVPGGLAHVMASPFMGHAALAHQGLIASRAQSPCCSDPARRPCDCALSLSTVTHPFSNV
jgi:hypothetical protein